MQHLLRPAPAPCGRQFEDGPPRTVDAAIVGRAIEIARGIEDQAGVRRITVRPPTACRSYAAPSPSSPRSHWATTRTPSRRHNCPRGGAVEIAGGIEDQAGLRESPVRHRCQSYTAPSPSSRRSLLGVNSKTVPQLWRAQSKRRPRRSCRRDCRRHRRSGRRGGQTPSAPLPKLCSTFSVQLPPAEGVNSNTVPLAVQCRQKWSCRRDCRRHRRSAPASGYTPSVLVAEAIQHFFLYLRGRPGAHHKQRRGKDRQRCSLVRCEVFYLT